MAEPAVSLQPIDLLLEEGTEDELRAMRSRVAEDPKAAMELADTVALVEQFRTLRTEPSAELAGRLYAIVRRADRRLPRPAPRVSLRLAAAAAAAIVGFGGAAAVGDAREEPIIAPVVAAARPEASTPVPPESARAPVPTIAERLHQDSVAAMRRRFAIESAPALAAALEEAEGAERNPLDSWLNPRNLLALRQLDHELRTRPEIRLRALRSTGAMAATDERVQALADLVAETLAVPGGLTEVRETALAVRALVAAGVTPGPRERAFTTGTDWLCEQLPRLRGTERVHAVAALVECAAVDDRMTSELVAAGEAMLAEVMVADEDVWNRSRPQLLRDDVPGSVLGDAGRALALLPALGVDGERCAFVRRLLLGELQSRQTGVSDGPDLLAAILYGYGDLLSERDGDWLVLQLRRWKPVRLAPDYVTVHQLAWGVEPGRRGFTRLQLDLRQLVILPSPRELAARAAMCLCLASNFAGHSTESLARFCAIE